MSSGGPWTVNMTVDMGNLTYGWLQLTRRLYNGNGALGPTFRLKKGDLLTLNLVNINISFPNTWQWSSSQFNQLFLRKTTSVRQETIMATGIMHKTFRTRQICTLTACISVERLELCRICSENSVLSAGRVIRRPG